MSNLLRQEGTQLYSKYLNIFYWHQVCPGPVLKSYHPATFTRIPSPAHLNQKAGFSHHQFFSFISRTGLSHHWFTSKTHLRAPDHILQLPFLSLLSLSYILLIVGISRKLWNSILTENTVLLCGHVCLHFIRWRYVRCTYRHMFHIF